MNKTDREKMFLSDKAFIKMAKDKINEFNDKLNAIKVKTEKHYKSRAESGRTSPFSYDSLWIGVLELDAQRLHKEIKRFSYLMNRCRNEQNAKEGWVDNSPSKSFDLEAIKQIPIDTLIGEPVRSSGNRGYYKCPIPGHDEKTPSFIVKRDKNTWRCFGACASGGSVIDLYMALNGCEFKEACKELCG